MSIFNQSRRYRVLAAALKESVAREGGTCCIPTEGCPRVFDITLHHNDPWAFTVHHIIPRSLGGAVEDPANMAPAHRRCNEVFGQGRRSDNTRNRWEEYESDLRIA